MSRGPGKLQDSILRTLASEADTSATVETLRWSLYEKRYPPIPSGGTLPTAWNTSFQRAVAGLVDRARITLTSRPLRGLNECAQHYPGKTLKSDLRCLRLTFLPVLLEWTAEAGGLSPKYDDAANELHHLRLLRRDRSKIAYFKNKWAEIEERLRPIYGSATSQSDDLLQLICKGRDLFGASDVRVRYSFALTVLVVCKRGVLPKELEGDLEAFVGSFMPPHVVDTLRLRSFIHELADVPNRGPCSLKTATLEYLHNRRRDLVEALPGFRIREPGIWIGPEERFEYPPVLRRLFDHTVFRTFDFVSLN